MPFEIMDQRTASASSHFFEDIRFPAERQVGFWKPNTMSDNQDKLVGSSPLEKVSADCMELPPTNLARDQEEKLDIGWKGITNLSEPSWNSVNHHPKSLSNLYMQPALNFNRNSTNANVIQHESSLFSSSLSEIFSRKLRLLGNDLSFQHASKAVSHHEEEPFKSMEEIEAQTIGNLLPDEDDLFSGVIDELGLNTHASKGDELEDFDLFSSGGGMELEGDDRVSMGPRNSDLIGVFNGQGGSNGSIVGEHPYGEHPSRTLFVRNINSNVEDPELKALFEQYGDIRTLYTACKHRGFVMVSYYDIRAARNAMRALQNKPLRRRKLDIHYSIPKDNPSEKDVNQGMLMVFNLDSSVSPDELQRIFGAFGEIKEIRETPHKHNHKFIEFYDVRAAEAALHALNRSDIAGKQIKLEPSRPGGVRRFMQQSEHEQAEPNLCESPFDELLPGHIVSPGVIASSCMDNGSTQVVAHVNTFFEPHRSSSVPINLASPARVAPIGKQLSLREPNHSLDEMKFANQGVPSFHPHSFPEYHDSLANGIPFNSSSTITDMASSVGPMMAEGRDNRQIWGASSNGHVMEPNAGVFGSSGNGNLSLNGNHYMWNNSKSHQQHPSSAMVWPNSPSFVNGIHANRLPHIPAFPRAPPVMLNVGSPVHHHIGSAPPVNSAFWDRRHPYAGESPETSGIPQRCFWQPLMSTVEEPMILFICQLTSRQNKCNVGYAFINMIDPQQTIPFYKVFNGKKWEKFNSEKVASLAYARIQGKAALIAHFQNSSLMNEDKRCRPILFHTDGPNAGDQEPFPMGTNIRSRPGRPRTTGNEENHSQGCSSTLANGEEFSNGAESLLGSSKDSD
ncbi:hypothetical protein CRYUN_Cryun12cG0181700 [Craigia yunnanensis]